MISGPIFIHALFRTGSTYIWNKFRQLPGYLCYYEPFHQLLAGISPKNVKDTLTQNFKTAGHPDLDKHYLYEYESLLRENVPGVPFFKKELSFDWFCQSGGESNPDQKKYIDFLIQAAGTRIPLFQFNRTALRSGWFKSDYPDSLNIYLYRNPRDQWQSYAAIQARSGYDRFFIMDLIALSKNREQTFLRPLANAIPLLKFHSATYADEELFYRILSQAYDEKEKYFIFYYLWLISLIENALHADMLWDINAIASDIIYRKKVQQRLVDGNIGSIDFNDCHITRYSDFPLPPDTMTEIETQVQELIIGIYAKDHLTKIASTLPSEMRNGFQRQKEKSIGDLRRELKTKDEQLMRFSDLLASESNQIENKEKQIEALTGALVKKEESISLLYSDLGKKKQEIEALTGALGKKEESIGLLCSDLENKEQEIEALTGALGKKEESISMLDSDLGKKKQEIEALTGALGKKEESIGLLNSDLGKKKQEIEALTGALAEKRESNALLQAKLNILMRSHSYRIGRSIIFPMRLGKKMFLKLKRFPMPNGLPKIAHAGMAAVNSCAKKIAVAEQIHLDFGSHRSGLKYGLKSLLALHNPQGVMLDAFIERTFCWQPHRENYYKKPWIGFIHVPPRMPEWFQPHMSNAAIFKSEQWQKSLPWCRGLFAFSKYHQRFLAKSLPVPVETLRLPSETPDLTWSWKAFESNPQKKLVQIGWWLRKYHAIFQFPKTSFKKVFLRVEHHRLPELMAKEKEILIRDGTFHMAKFDSVTTVPFISNQEYDVLLSRNIAFMFLYDSSACNAIVECIVRGTPILINRLEAVVEYLGEEYPLYFSSLEEAAAKIENRDLLFAAHQYLEALSLRQQLSGEYFLQSFANSKIYQSL